MKKLDIFPIPKELKYGEDITPASTVVLREINSSLAKEEYIIIIGDKKIELHAATEIGFFRAQTTLNQIKTQCGEILPDLYLHDYPDFDVRGLTYCNGGRTPTIEELKHMIDLLADMKINQLQIYVDAGSFEYKSFPTLARNPGCFTAEEIRELSRYSAERFVDLVPCTQVFGHCATWLHTPELHDLAECPEKEWADTFDPSDPRTLDHACRVFDDLIEVFDSAYFNSGCDEPHELGEGKNKEICEKVGRDSVVIEFMNKLNGALKERGKVMQYWGEMLVHAPLEKLQTLPKDAILLDWGYERQDVWEGFCERLQQANVPYYVCPGNGVWMGMLGKSYNTVQNIARSAAVGKKFGAAGLLNTDWMDEGLLFYSSSYLGFAYGAAMGWSTDSNDYMITRMDSHPEYIPEPDSYQMAKMSPTLRAVFHYLNRVVFKDTTETMAQVMYDAGQVSELAPTNRAWNTTHLKKFLIQSLDDGNTNGFEIEDCINVLNYLTVIKYRLSLVQLHCYDAEQIIDEYKTAIDMTEYAAKIGLWKLGAIEEKDCDFFVREMQTMQTRIISASEFLIAKRCKTVRSIRDYFSKFDK